VDYFRISAVDGTDRLPFSLKVLLENLLRTEDGVNVTPEQIAALANWNPAAEPDTEIQFSPARVVMQDFTGVPASSTSQRCARPSAIWRRPGPGQSTRTGRVGHRPLGDRRPVRTPDAFERNVELEYSRNRERYQFLRWGQTAFDQFKVVPPGTGIVHQVNIEYLARVVFEHQGVAYPDTWSARTRTRRWSTGSGAGLGVGGIEAEAAMLGQPVSMLIPRWSDSS
jgi:aconitate hydratase